MHHKATDVILKLMIAALAWPGAANAHASEQGFVLLLPTDFYTGAGVAVVVLTVLALAVLPARGVEAVFRTRRLTRRSARRIRPVTSMASFFLLSLLIWAGFDGPRDPLSNPLPLMVWTVFWIGFVTVQGLIGDLWSYVNPWTGPLRLLRQTFGPPVLLLPARLGLAMGGLSFLAFSYLLLADPAPSDPARLARFVGMYWLFTALMAVIFGPRWLRRAEGITLMMTAYARFGMLARRGGVLRIGLPGWQIANAGRMPLILAVMITLLLGTGSFDGLNETFWWLARLDINPLEFPGRSAVILQNAAGVLLANLALLGVLLITFKLGLMLAASPMGLRHAFCLFAPSILPIALGYHVAHYLPSFLVESQYALVALSDPFLNGADWLGLGEFYVTTGFFNQQSSVRVIFLSQASAVVIGHVLAVLVAHVVAVRHFGSTRRAVLSQTPIALFMVGYTFFGLWLLASPRF
jgi:hypothetical protein